MFLKFTSSFLLRLVCITSV